MKLLQGSRYAGIGLNSIAPRKIETAEKSPSSKKDFSEPHLS